MSNEPNFGDFMAELLSGDDVKRAMHKGQHITAADVRGLYELYNEKHEFKPGDIVMFKAGLSVSKWPDYDEPAVVVKYESGRMHTDESGSLLENSPADLWLGCVNDERFVIHWHDAQRFEPYVERPESEEEAPEGAVDFSAVLQDGTVETQTVPYGLGIDSDIERQMTDAARDTLRGEIDSAIISGTGVLDSTTGINGMTPNRKH